MKLGELTIGEADTDIDGYFELSLDDGTYDFVISKLGYMQRTIPGVVITEGASINLANNDNPISLLAGDVNGDGSINANDLSVLLVAFNKTASDAGYNEAADFNRDDSINATDLSKLLASFNKTSSNYAPWVLP